MEVWWQTVVDEINQLLNDKDYQKAYDLTLKIIRGLDKDKIENWIAYKDILIYKHNDKKYIEKYLNPLKELLKIEFPALNEFIQQVDIINVALEELYFYIEKQLEDYRNEDYYYVLLTIINQYEIIAHKLNEALNKVTENKFLQVSLNYHFDLNNLINSLNSSLRRLLDEEKSFFNEDDIIDPDMYLTKLKEQYKYDFTIIMCKINSILDVYEALKDKIVIIESYNGDEFKLRYNHENFIKYNLPQIRKQEFDNEYFIKNSTEIPSEFQPLTANELTKLVELKKNHFLLKIDFESKEFYKNLQTVLYDFRRAYDFIWTENYINPDSLDNKVVLKNRKMQFSFNDILDFRISLAALANFYYVGEQCFISEKKTNSNSLSISINRKELKMYIQGVLHNCFNRKINNQALDELLDFYTYGNNDIWDLFFNPLIKYRDKYIIIPFVVMQTDFGRIFINHLNKLDIQLKEGDLFEKCYKSILEEHGFKVYNPEKSQLNFITKRGHKGDIDILAIKDNYIFCGQLKNKAMPLDRQDFVNYDRKLSKALNQLKYVEEYIRENPKKILDYYKLKDLDQYKIIRFYVSSSFYRSGEYIDGIYITDMSANNKFFDDGKIKVNIKDNIETIVLRENDKASAAEFKEFLKNPYFLWKGIYL